MVFIVTGHKLFIRRTELEQRIDAEDAFEDSDRGSGSLAGINSGESITSLIEKVRICIYKDYTIVHYPFFLGEKT